MMSLCRIALFLAVLITSSGNAFASCQDFLNDVDTTSLGVSYKKDPETGRISALMMMGQISITICAALTEHSMSERADAWLFFTCHASV